jgi:hypothetical protein
MVVRCPALLLVAALCLTSATTAVRPAHASALQASPGAGDPKVKYCTRHKRPRGCVRVPKAAKRPRKRDQQGPDSLTPRNVENGGGLGGGPGDHRDAALGWARSQRRLRKWAWRCQRFVEEAYGTRGKFDTAKQAAAKLGLRRGPVANAPPGALVYFGADRANRGFGHVGLSLGRGRMISALATVTVTDIARSRYWRGLYLGWADAPVAWPGRIPLPPGPTIEDPGLTIRVTAPAFGSFLSGTVRVAATATGASGVDFFSYYATNPRDAATRAWYRIGSGRRADGAWVVDWDTTIIPDQGNPLWGTVNVAAVAVRDGRSTATRDYRRFTVDNRLTGGGAPPSDGGAVPRGALNFVDRIDAASARVMGWARDADDFAAPIIVTALVDGEPAGHGVADLARGDVGAHGFSFIAATDEARRTVCIRGTNIGLGVDAQVGDCAVIPRYADLNDDGRVDCADVDALRARYGQAGGDEDLNNDGTVNIFDLSILLSRADPGTGPCP